MKKIFKNLVAISGFIALIATNSISINAHGKDLPIAGFTTLTEFTEEEALAAYTEKIEEEIAAQELKLMSSIIYCEAGNQCEAGKQAVGIVVMNRVEDEANFGSTVEEVIYWPGQFRPRYDKGLNKAFRMYDNGELPEECIEAARYALVGNKTVVYKGEEIDMSSYYYFARHWSKASIRIEDHDFR